VISPLSRHRRQLGKLSAVAWLGRYGGKRCGRRSSSWSRCSWDSTRSAPTASSPRRTSGTRFCAVVYAGLLDLQEGTGDAAESVAIAAIGACKVFDERNSRITCVRALGWRAATSSMRSSRNAFGLGHSLGDHILIQKTARAETLKLSKAAS